MQVGLGGRQFQLGDEPVHLVDDENGLQLLDPGLAEHGDCLAAHALDGVDQHHGAIAQARGGGYLGLEVDVAGRVDQVDQVLVDVGGVVCGGAAQHGEEERDGARLHGDAAELLIGARVEVADLAGELGRYDAVCGEEGIGERRFAVVDVGEDADVSDVVGQPLEVDELLGGYYRHFVEFLSFDLMWLCLAGFRSN